jgi:hypothetical protein
VRVNHYFVLSCNVFPCLSNDFFMTLNLLFSINFVVLYKIVIFFFFFLLTLRNFLVKKLLDI